MKKWDPSLIRSYVRTRMQVLREDGKGNIYCVCPNCGGEDSKFSVNPEKGVFNCWRGTCHYRGYFPRLFDKYGEVDASYEVTSEDMAILQDNPLYNPHPELDQSLYFEAFRSHCVPLDHPSLMVKMFLWEADWSKRHFSGAQLVKCGVRYCPQPFSLEAKIGKLSGYFVIPYLSKGGVPEYFQFRASAEQTPKWKFPKETASLKRDLHLYQVNPQFSGDYRIVTESIYDAIRLGESAVSISGSAVSRAHISRFSLMGCRTLFVFLDGDDAGRKATSVIASQLQKYTMARILVPPSQWFSIGKDPDELSNEELSHLYSLFTEFNEAP